MDRDKQKLNLIHADDIMECPIIHETIFHIVSTGYLKHLKGYNVLLRRYKCKAFYINKRLLSKVGPI